MNNFFDGIAKAGRELFGLKSDESGELAARCHELLKLKGEAAAIAHADTLLASYRTLDGEEKARFFAALLDELEPDAETVSAAIAAWQETPGPESLARLNKASESSRRDLIRAFNLAPGGTAALVSKRADLLEQIRNEPRLASLDGDFSYVFQSWFNRGFLELRKIDWQTPAYILEKLIAYEAVHEIQGWPDLRRRLAGDRRCFAFFHPALPDEPLIFVEVALVEGLASNIQDLLSADGELNTPPDTAVFYSISNCQRGLASVTFGNFLIKQVADTLAAEIPSLRTFATLSPIPGFCRWLEAARRGSDELPLDDAETGELDMLLLDGWPRDDAVAAALQPQLLRLCAHYLLKVKRGREPQDAVARFHLRNGARLERINAQADLSEKGLSQSAGMMVNYVYDRKTVLRNHEAFVNNGKVAAASAVRKLAS